MSLRMFELWWPAVAPGGRFVIRDGREPRVEGSPALVEDLRSRQSFAFEEPAPGVFSVVISASGA